MKLSILTSYSCKNGKEMYKKVCCTCKIVVCLLNLWLLWSSRCRRRRLILRYLFFFLPGDVTRSSPILCVNECIHDGNLVPRFSQGRARCKFRALYDACSDANILKRVLGTRVNPDMCRIRVDVQIWFEHGYVWTWNFWIRKEIVADSKISGYVWIRVWIRVRVIPL